ncbi:hypothetical protein [uncultured Croceicoccus sp.]|uniref:hypothetical protein n=1 Tax=uncultured Croceicoccus sp. TaxID=1295329 RepID=UPI0026114884|nr:hypothetical protein [uncultured Croceicoccus sp.]
MTASVFGDKLSDSGDGVRSIGAITAQLVGVKLSAKTRARLGRGDSPRSGEPVWRNSYYRGQIEDRVWKPIHDGTKHVASRWKGALLDRAKKLEDLTRRKRREKHPGCENGILGHVGIQVLEYLFGLVDYATGRLEPAIGTIAEAIGRSYSATHRALVRLRDAGFLRWMRRSEPIENPEPDGPQVRQISNAYALLVPQELRGWLGRLLRPGPTPACAKDHLAADQAELDAIAAKMTCAEWHASIGPEPKDKATHDSLAACARAVDARDLREASTANPPRTERPWDYSNP